MNSRSRRPVHRASILVVTLIAATLVTAAVPARPAAAAATPRPAPGCQGAPIDPQIGDLCPDDQEPEEFSVSVDGDIGGGAEVSIATDIPPCVSQDPVTDVFSPDGCYSGMDFTVDTDPLCSYVDSYDQGSPRPIGYRGKAHVACNSSYVDGEGSFGLPLLYTLQTNMDYVTGLSQDSCKPAFDTNYLEGGDATDPDAVWAVRGPASLSCTFTRNATAPNGADAEPDGLFGPTWIEATVILRVEYADGSQDAPGTTAWLPVDGNERPRKPVAAFDWDDPVAGLHTFVNGSSSQLGHPMTYDWTFEVADEGDAAYRPYDTSTAEHPEILFDEGDYFRATLTVTDTVNGKTANRVRGDRIYRGGGGGDPGGDLPVVTLRATDTSAGERGRDPGLWTLKRTKATGQLTVNVAASGTATPGADYVRPPATVTFAAGKDTATVPLIPIDDRLREPVETARLTLQPGNGYTVGDPKLGDIAIHSDDHTVPATPTIASVKAKKAKHRAVVRFVSGDDGGLPISGYQARCAPGKGKAKKARALRSPMTLKGLKKGRKYRCQVRARNSEGWSAWSARSKAFRAK